MPRKKLSEDDKKVKFEFWIEGKYLKNQNKDELKEIAYNAIISHVTN